MDEQKTYKTLKAMRAALRTARDQKKDDLNAAGWTTEIAKREYLVIGNRASDNNFADELNHASARGMLERQPVADGQEKYSIETDRVKDSEKYQKRPTTRAIKKARGRSSGISM